jgi:hypothetical protein
MVEYLKDALSNEPVEAVRIDYTARDRIYFAADRNFQLVVMSVTMRIIAFSEQCPVLFF